MATTSHISLPSAQHAAIVAIDPDADVATWIVEAVDWWAAQTSDCDWYYPVTVLTVEAAADLEWLATDPDEDRLNLWLALAHDMGWKISVAAAPVLGETFGAITARVHAGQQALDDPGRAPDLLAAIPPVPIPVDTDWRAPDRVDDVQVTWPDAVWNQLRSKVERLDWTVDRGCRQSVADQLFLSGTPIAQAGCWPSVAAVAEAQRTRRGAAALVS